MAAAARAKPLSTGRYPPRRSAARASASGPVALAATDTAITTPLTWPICPVPNQRGSSVASTDRIDEPPTPSSTPWITAVAPRADLLQEQRGRDQRSDGEGKQHSGSEPIRGTAGQQRGAGESNAPAKAMPKSLTARRLP